MRLVIAEKPSVAQSIAAVLGAKSRRDGDLVHRVVVFRASGRAGRRRHLQCR